jgi:hypothetical protein
MSLAKFLQGIGDRLGILETVSNPAATTPRRIQTRTVTIRELACEIKSAEVRDLAASPEEVAIPFEKIYEAAGITANDGDWTIGRLERLTAGELSKNKSREEIQEAVLEVLRSEGVPVETIVKDAIARDQALDSFETCAGDKMKNQINACKERLLEIEAQIRNLQQESVELGEKIKANEEHWRDWKKRKRACEREMAKAIGYIIDQPIVTTDDDGAE